MTRYKKVFLAIAGCLTVGVCAGAVLSNWYWGYPFARPALPEASQARRVLSVTSLRAARRGSSCTLEAETIPDLRGHLAGLRKYVDEFPDLRALVALEDRGLLPREARAPAWLEPSVLYQAVVDAGIVVGGDAGYDTAGCFGGYAIELSLPSGESRLLLTAAGPEVSNDHHPYYELVFRREGTRLVPERKHASFFDIAGIEGLEWPLLHCICVLLCFLVAGASAAVFWMAKAVARWVERRRLTTGWTLS
jgi:hypothetical protein